MAQLPRSCVDCASASAISFNSTGIIMTNQSLTSRYNEATAQGNHELADQLFDLIEQANEEATLWAYGE